MKPGGINLYDTYGTYNIFEKNKKFYAISKDIKDSAEEIINQKKAIEGTSKEKLIDILKDIDQWSNSRGTYESNSNENAKVYLRANSFNMFDEKISKNYDEPVILKIKDKLFITDKKNKIFNELKHNNKIIQSTDLKKYDFLSDFGSDCQPELIFEYEKYNIVEIDKLYFGVKCSQGDVDWFNHDLFNDKKILKSDTIKGVMHLIDTEIIAEKKIKNFFQLFNFLVRLIKVVLKKVLIPIKYIFYVDKTPESKSKQKETKFQTKLLKIKENELKFSKNPEITKKERFIKVYQHFNIFLFEEIYYAVPKSYKEFHFQKSDLISDNKILYDVSLDNLESVINEI